MVNHSSNVLYILERQKIVKTLLKQGLSSVKISKRLNKIENGKYAASQYTILRDIKVVVKTRQNWEKIHIPHQMDVYQQERQGLIDELNVLIRKAKKKRQYKTAGELITKKARLLGVDKFIAPKEKKKDDIEEKYQHKTQEEINDVLFKEFKELSATLIRMIRERQLNNIIRMTIRIVRVEENEKKVKYIITRFGEEKKIYIEQAEFRNKKKA